MGNVYSSWIPGAMRSVLSCKGGHPRRYLGNLNGPDGWCIRNLAGPGRPLIAYEGPYPDLNIPRLKGKAAWRRDPVCHTGAAHSHIFKIVSRLDLYSPHRF
ncbi:hypothetical protein HHI36_000432 [Cryptolaemus montrouzieri]|uniref:Uncharacterized protein n=1 Tax=Cryptolaemus montrouzieri TaxID=559131 RepID=A0ABD2P4N2_9CUCU